MLCVFHVVVSIDESKCFVYALISFFLHSLTKSPDNNTPAVKTTASSMSLEAMFVARFVAAAFWRGCGQIFLAATSCAAKVRNKSLRVSSGLSSLEGLLKVMSLKVATESVAGLVHIRRAGGSE